MRPLDARTRDTPRASSGPALPLSARDCFLRSFTPEPHSLRPAYMLDWPATSRADMLSRIESKSRAACECGRMCAPDAAGRVAAWKQGQDAAGGDRGSGSVLNPGHEQLRDLAGVLRLRLPEPGAGSAHADFSEHVARLAQGRGVFHARSRSRSLPRPSRLLTPASSPATNTRPR
ncbi:hypothetical protein L227DRAFT_184641 [Lentinus tigrinus ALCF2SS1-6]|uniref:Uncharacterized protein n=1 Tax=Lentinus tigrinus ALCF2SS1-6 TaxID=1328759 RepID=A0A5C2S540_9APHY|nr:hypothetical protein L227DRAFT_184641 [Lentinus tigrinus ALCF2SS1-6]